jgi:SulP family sulfate permease
MVLIVVGAPALVGYVAMPALGALLILAGLGSLRWSEIVAVMSTRWEARVAGGSTFVATLFLPIQAAVGFGVVLSILLFVRESAMDVRLVELVEREDGNVEEREAPRTLAAGTVTVLSAYGDLFYAGARTLGNVLPSPPPDGSAAVVLRLRGRLAIGTTLIDVIARYADELKRTDGRLYLAGVSGDSEEWLRDSPRLRKADVQFFQATPVLGESMRLAAGEARRYLEERRGDAVDATGG